jgi:predicted small lipoprotein YifL
VRRLRTKRSTQRPQSTQRILFSAIAAISLFLFVTGCGKKGPPLPPLVKLPVAPENLVAERRGNIVDVQFNVPGTNTDGTRPANVARAEVYAITAPVTPTPLTDEQLLKLATKIGAVQVKAPRNPNLTADADDPSDEVDAPEGPGLEQGALTRFEEPLTAEMLQPVEVPKDPKAPASTTDDGTPRPLLAPPAAVLSRTYVALSTSPRGRKGPLSPRVVVPLVPSPPPPSTPKFAYDETNVTVTWPAVGTPAEVQAPAGGAAGDVLPSTPIGAARPPIAYNVYDTTNPESPLKLTKAPIAEPRFLDGRMVWGEKRCYTVRTAESVGGFTIESDAPPAWCETLVDTFAPAAPKGVAGIPSEGAINLIWEPNTEKDLEGYIVMRAAAPHEALEAITPAPIQETSFKDAVQGGVQYVYTVKAVDKAGNASPPSPPVAETAR